MSAHMASVPFQHQPVSLYNKGRDIVVIFYLSFIYGRYLFSRAHLKHYVFMVFL